MLSANLMHSSSGKEIMRYRDRVLSNCRVMAGGQRAFLEALIVFRRLDPILLTMTLRKSYTQLVTASGAKSKSTWGI